MGGFDMPIESTYKHCMGKTMQTKESIYAAAMSAESNLPAVFNSIKNAKFSF